MAKRKLTKAQLKRKRQAIARRNFGLTKPRRKTRKLSRSTKRGDKVARRKRRTSSRTTGTLRPMQVLIGGGIYGALRSKLSNLLAPVTSKVPLGTIGDEAVLFVAAQQLGKRMRDKTIKSVSNAAMAVEAARIGEALSDGSAFGASSSGAAVSGFPTLG